MSKALVIHRRGPAPWGLCAALTLRVGSDREFRQFAVRAGGALVGRSGGTLRSGGALVAGGGQAMLMKDWLPAVLTVCGGVLLFLLGKLWDGRGSRSAAAKSYNEKVFGEMVALFDELKEKARDADVSAKEAKSLAASVLDESQKRVTEAQTMVTEAHKTVSEAQASAAAAQRSAMEAQVMVTAGQQREAEVNRQLAKAWERVDALDSRVRDMEQSQAGLVGGAIGLNPRKAARQIQAAQEPE